MAKRPAPTAASILAVGLLIAGCSSGASGAAVPVKGDAVQASTAASASLQPSGAPAIGQANSEIDASGSASASASSSPSPSSLTDTRTGPVVVAIGDSYTAGYGFYADGAAVGSMSLINNCISMKALPASAKNDPCSSNSAARNMRSPLEFAPDYGFGNQVSWAAQVATALGVTPEQARDSYANLAISGSTAREWADDAFAIPSVSNKNGLAAVADLDPDVVLMTLGGNPTLTRVLTDKGDLCLKLDQAQDMQALRSCFAKLIAEDGTRDALVTVYTRLLDTTKAKVVVLTYPTVIPKLGDYSPGALVLAGAALNDAVLSAVNDVRSSHADGERLLVGSPRFHVGLTPGSFTAAACDAADGESNQSTFTQSYFETLYGADGWCKGSPLLISTDTGIHPNKSGYAEFARAALAALGQ